MNLRPYTTNDRSRCLEIFDLNCPRYFAYEERENLAEYLDHPDGPYFILENDEGQALGCGGYALEASGAASLVWGMIHPQWHRQGLGRFLAMYRLREISRQGGVQLVRMDTTEQSVGFYEKLGFRVIGVKKDGYAPGLDRIELIKKLEVCG
jgi:ribosomal protein S18 acetylase RimI-like enzyme